MSAKNRDEGKIMAKLDARKAGSFRINGEVEIHRLGFGAMRITGPHVWGPPLDMAEALRTLKRLPELGIDFIDTANSYGPEVSEQLIREALYPYNGILIATKAGLRRPRPEEWERDGRPEHLRDQAIQSRARLGLKQIGLWQLHAIDPKVPRNEQLAAVKSLLDDGIIRHAGLSNVTVADIQAASKLFRVATVQNRYNLIDRDSEDVLNYCEKHGIGFIPWFPLAAGRLAETGSILDGVAKAHNATPSQIALAWVLKRSPVMLPIPGTSKVAHLEENVAALNITLSDEEFDALDREGRKEYR
jgi:pyridoxine 4-dehydrogenase